MKMTDEMLMAYADDELDVETRARVAAELAKDPALAKKVEQHRALRAHLRGAFDPVLEEPLPERLRALVTHEPQSAVISLAEARTTRSAQKTPRFLASRMSIGVSLAASVVFGILIGVFAFNRDHDIVAQSTGLVAKGVLARALTVELASQSIKGPIQIGLSYQTNSGEYCRTFAIVDERRLSGLACHPQDSPRDSWRIRMLVPIETSSNANYRNAASSIPASVIEQVNREIKGETLDADQEAAAAARGWTSR